MKKLTSLPVLLAAVCFFTIASAAQAPSKLTRTTVKSDKFDFGAGGTLEVVGSPVGSITVEGWSRSEVEISAEIEVEAANEADLERLSAVVGFQLQESTGRVGIISVGPHNRRYVASIDKKFPRHLAANAYRIDYVIKVPAFCDLQIDGGKGDLTLSGVEGAMKINFLESNAKLSLVGGGVMAVFGKGEVDISIPARSWRGRFADIQLASGTMTLSLPAGLNADLDASILRTGKIENAFAELKPRERRQEFTDRSITAKAGTGGVTLKFSVGDGTMKILADGKRPA